MPKSPLPHIRISLLFVKAIEKPHPAATFFTVHISIVEILIGYDDLGKPLELPNSNLLFEPIPKTVPFSVRTNVCLKPQET